MILSLKLLIFVLMCTATVLLAVLAFKSRKLTRLYSQDFGGRPDIAKAQREKYALMRRQALYSTLSNQKSD
jgi:hypothetical protein